MDSFKIVEQGNIYKIVCKTALIVYLQGKEHCIYPCTHRDFSYGISEYYFTMDNPDIYELYLNGVMQEQFNPITVIPKKEHPKKSFNKFLFNKKYVFK